MLRNGLYEQVINKALEGELATTDKLMETAPIDGGESSKVLSKYIAEIIEKGLDNVRDSGGALADQVELVNKIVATRPKKLNLIPWQWQNAQNNFLRYLTKKITRFP